MKRSFLYGALFLSCSFGMVTAHAAPSLQSMDCRHLVVEDVRLSDKISARQNHDTTAAEKGSAFSVSFDPFPGFGIMNGMTLTPSGHGGVNEWDDMKLEDLEKRLSEVQALEQQKLCPNITVPSDEQPRLSDAK